MLSCSARSRYPGGAVLLHVDGRQAHSSTGLCCAAERASSERRSDGRRREDALVGVCTLFDHDDCCSSCFCWFVSADLFRCTYMPDIRRVCPSKGEEDTSSA